MFECTALCSFLKPTKRQKIMWKNVGKPAVPQQKWHSICISEFRLILFNLPFLSWSAWDTFQILADDIQRVLFSCYRLWMTFKETPGSANIVWCKNNAGIKGGRSSISWQFCSPPSLLFLFCLYNGYKIWSGSMMSMHPLSIIDMMNNLSLLTPISPYISGNFIHQPHLKCLSNLSDVWSTETPLLEIYATNILSN